MKRLVVRKGQDSPNGQLSPEDNSALLVGPNENDLSFGKGEAPWCLDKDNDAVLELD